MTFLKNLKEVSEPTRQRNSQCKGPETGVAWCLGGRVQRPVWLEQRVWDEGRERLGRAPVSLF